MNVINKPLICPSCMEYRDECECDTVNPPAPEEKGHTTTSVKAIKRKAKIMRKKIEALKLEALNVAVYLEDEGHGLASAHFLSIGDGLLKASNAAELLA